MKEYKYFLLVLGVIILDQSVKLLVHYNMHLYQEFNVLGDWFRIHYILNEGIAFGLKADWQYSKLILSIFRFAASVGGVYLLASYAKKGIHPGALWAGALILAGAVGNLIDSMFYGIIFDNMPYGAPFAFMNGQVVDMLYFPIFKFTWPEWMPYLGGSNFHFFSAIFNIADSSIFIGVMVLLIWQKRFFPENKKLTRDEILPTTLPVSEIALERQSEVEVSDENEVG